MNLPTTSTVPNKSLSHQDVVIAVRQTVTRGVQAMGFWLAIVVPFLYPPLLVRGFAGPSEVLAFVGLLVLNVVALVVGHGHRR